METFYVENAEPTRYQGPPVTTLRVRSPRARACADDIGALEPIEIGGIMTDAHRVAVSGANDAWIAPDGTVLRVAIMMRRMNAWIRLLRASEY